MYYAEWEKHCCDRTCEKVLKTIDHILENSNSHLDSQELDDLKDCWMILHYTHHQCCGGEPSVAVLAKKPTMAATA